MDLGKLLDSSIFCNLKFNSPVCRDESKESGEKVFVSGERVDAWHEKGQRQVERFADGVILGVVEQGGEQGQSLGTQ